MPEAAVQTVGLRKVLRPQRGRRVAVDDVDLTLPAGGVHALLGAPGSGRTEVLRLLLGLSRPSRGSVRVLGHDVQSDVAAALERVGAMVEAPVFTPSFSGRRNLQLLARTAGLDDDRVDAVVERLGLANSIGHRYAGYSVGERQLLALAAALLKDPDLLVLDEPTADLDPAAARDVLTLLRERGDAGRTVLFSTDDPSAAYLVCDEVVVIDEGRVLASGPAEEVVGEARARTRVRVAEPERAEHLLTAAGFDVERSDRDLLVSGHDHPEEVTRRLAAHEVYVEELAVVRPDLEALLAGLRKRPAESKAS